ncbi:hypothetical protein [Cronobacter sakazakii]|uniref:hypothetical protein n=2 Tax=Cronobacter sakazakii TaxID=28141 RepID=UPI0015C58172|nr:hypothetical protein [Cronobacter sakazakii]
MRKQKKPSGISTSIRIEPSKIKLEKASFPSAKEDLEKLMAETFCEGKPALNPQITYYGCFYKLEPQSENSLDFKVETEKRGGRWLELAEFAPLKYFGGKYDNVPSKWNNKDMMEMFLELIKKKSSKHYGDGVILLVYITHDLFFVPPPIIRAIRKTLESSVPLPPFETIYFMSLGAARHAKVWQVWPSLSKDDGPIAKILGSNLIL